MLFLMSNCRITLGERNVYQLGERVIYEWINTSFSATKLQHINMLHNSLRIFYYLILCYKSAFLLKIQHLFRTLIWKYFIIYFDFYSLGIRKLFSFTLIEMHSWEKNCERFFTRFLRTLYGYKVSLWNITRIF